MAVQSKQVDATLTDNRCRPIYIAFTAQPRIYGDEKRGRTRTMTPSEVTEMVGRQTKLNRTPVFLRHSVSIGKTPEDRVPIGHVEEWVDDNGALRGVAFIHANTRRSRLVARGLRTGRLAAVSLGCSHYDGADGTKLMTEVTELSIVPKPNVPGSLIDLIGDSPETFRQTMKANTHTIASDEDCGDDWIMEALGVPSEFLDRVSVQTIAGEGDSLPENEKLAMTAYMIDTMGAPAGGSLANMSDKTTESAPQGQQATNGAQGSAAPAGQAPATPQTPHTQTPATQTPAAPKQAPKEPQTPAKPATEGDVAARLAALEKRLAESEAAERKAKAETVMAKFKPTLDEVLPAIEAATKAATEAKDEDELETLNWMKGVIDEFVKNPQVLLEEQGMKAAKNIINLGRKYKKAEVKEEVKPEVKDEQPPSSSEHAPQQPQPGDDGASSSGTTYMSNAEAQFQQQFEAKERQPETPQTQLSGFGMLGQMTKSLRETAQKREREQDYGGEFRKKVGDTSRVDPSTSVPMKTGGGKRVKLQMTPVAGIAHTIAMEAQRAKYQQDDDYYGERSGPNREKSMQILKDYAESGAITLVDDDGKKESRDQVINKWAAEGWRERCDSRGRIKDNFISPQELRLHREMRNGRDDNFAGFNYVKPLPSAQTIASDIGKLEAMVHSGVALDHDL